MLFSAASRAYEGSPGNAALSSPMVAGLAGGVEAEPSGTSLWALLTRSMVLLGMEAICESLISSQFMETFPAGF